MSISLSLLALCSSFACSPQAQGNRDEALIDFDLDTPTSTRHTLLPEFEYGFKAEIEIEHKANFNLDREDGRDDTSVKPKLSAALSYRFSDYAHAFLELQGSRDYRLREARRNSREIAFEVEQAYLVFKDVADGVSLQIGRQRFDDAREWYYDAELDGVRLIYRRNRFALETAVNRREIVTRDLRRRRRHDRVTNYFLTGYMAVAEDVLADAHAVYVDNHLAHGEKLLFIGIGASGEVTSRTDFWFQVAHVTGRENRRKVSGFGLDFGLTHTFKQFALRPYVTGGFAFGTGDDDPNDGTDRAFRQTGLQDNNDRFGGVTSFAYYGETLNPELSNLAIGTLGVGIRPSSRTSLDLVFHQYRQHYAANRLREAAIDENPAGRRRSVGRALDLILGFREITNVDVELVGGLFWPGSAFRRHRDRAYFFSAEAQFKF